jgi:hypothetical protein
MPTRDMGTVRAFIGDGGTAVDVHFPKGYDVVKSALKEMKGRWNPDRRCWTVTPRYASMDADGVVERIERALASVAPSSWAEAVRRFGGFACATRRYEVKVGAGGLRITLPQGHPSDWVLKQAEGAHKDGESWLVPSRSCATAEVGAVLQRVVAEDMALFKSAVEDHEGNSIRGTVPGGQPEGAGVALDRVVFADHSFLKVADTRVHNEPVHCWPFRVTGTREAEGGHELRLSYLDSDTAYRAVRHRMAQPEESRSRLLDVTHASGKWARRRDDA